MPGSGIAAGSPGHVWSWASSQVIFINLASEIHAQKSLQVRQAISLYILGCPAPESLQVLQVILELGILSSH